MSVSTGESIKAGPRGLNGLASRVLGKRLWNGGMKAYEFYPCNRQNK